MNDKKITRLEMLECSNNNYKMICSCLRYMVYRLMGIFWKKRIEIHENIITGDIIINYE